MPPRPYISCINAIAGMHLKTPPCTSPEVLHRIELTKREIAGLIRAKAEREQLPAEERDEIMLFVFAGIYSKAAMNGFDAHADELGRIVARLFEGDDREQYAEEILRLEPL